MFIPESLYILVNVVLIAIMVISLIIGFKRGFIYQLLDLLSFFIALLIAWFLAPILAEHLPFVHADETLLDAILQPLINILLWMVVIIIIFKVIFAFILPLFKGIKNIPVIGSVNAIGGLITGFINGFIWISILGILLMTPLVENGSLVREKTLFKPFNALSDKMVDIALNNIDSEIIEEGMNGINEYRDVFEKWLEENGVFDE